MEYCDIGGGGSGKWVVELFSQIFKMGGVGSKENDIEELESYIFIWNRVFTNADKFCYRDTLVHQYFRFGMHSAN